MKIKVLIADDHKMFREGVAALINKSKNIEVVGDVSNGADLKELLTSRSVNVILMDIDMGEDNGIELAKEIKSTYPEVYMLALSMHGERSYIVKMLEAGATGYILKNAGREEMISAIETVASGNTYFSNQVSSALIQHITNPKEEKEKSADTPLTHRETEVLKLIAEEYSNPEIAEKLFISVRTVDTHRRNLLDKLMVKNTAGLVKYALKHNLLD